MKRDIREILFLSYSAEVENRPPTEQDRTLNELLSLLDEQELDKLLTAITDVFNMEMREAYMAGFDAGTSVRR